MRVVLGPLAKSGLEAHVGPDLPAAVNTALVYYVGKLTSGQQLPPFPKSPAMQGKEAGGGEATPVGPRSSDPRVEVEVPVNERIEAALASDAGNQGVSVADIAGHAVLVYLAELDLLGGSAGDAPLGPDVTMTASASDADPTLR